MMIFLILEDLNIFLLLFVIFFIGDKISYHIITFAVQFLLLQVDGDTSTNDCVIALASGLSGSTMISSLDSHDAQQLQASLDAVCFSTISFSSLNEKN